MGAILDITPAEYYADPAPVPSLSSGVAKALVRRSPLHARAAHPRMGGASTEPTKAMDHGSILHRLILGHGDAYVAQPFDDYRKKEAQAARDEARAAGLIPVLADDLAELERAADAALAQMREHPDLRAFFGPGRSEAVVMWEEPGAHLRCMVDRMPDDPRAPWFDLKTVARSAAPVECQRAMVADHAFQRSFYLRSAHAIQRRPSDMLFVMIERTAPHGVSVMAAAPSLVEIADAEVQRAVDLWCRCMREDRWPGYDTRTAYVSAPAWLTQAEQNAMNDEEEIAA